MAVVNVDFVSIKIQVKKKKKETVVSIKMQVKEKIKETVVSIKIQVKEIKETVLNKKEMQLIQLILLRNTTKINIFTPFK